VPGDIYKPANASFYAGEIVCKGGNFLLNIGPSPEGTWADTAYARPARNRRLDENQWEAIYNSRPIRPSNIRIYAYIKT